MQINNPEMTAQDVIEFVELLNQHNIEVIIDGGWGVDALLGRQTRPHDDLDIAVQHKDASEIRTLLETLGWTEEPRDDSWECNFVMGDVHGHLIDIHSFTFDAAGQNVFGVAYPFDSLSGTGTIDGVGVRCIAPEWMVKFHSGYPLDENDYRDVKALCQHFGIPVPADYAEFEKRGSDLLPRFCRRVVLRRLTLADLADFQAYRRDPQVGLYQGWTPWPDAQAGDFLAEMSTTVLFQPDQWFQIGIAERDTNRLIGDIGLCVYAGEEQAKIGFTLRAESHGQGLAAEAVSEAIHFLFENTAVARLIGVADARNLASIRLMERLGMQRIAAENSLFHGEPCVEYSYALDSPTTRR